MLDEDKKFLALLVVLIILLVWSVLFVNGNKEKLHSYWYRTNCLPTDAIDSLKGSWKAEGSGAIYTFSSPKVALTPAEQAVVGTDQASGADLVKAVLKYAEERDLYRPGERYVRTNPALKDAFKTSSSYLSMRDIGALGSKIILTVSGRNGSTRDIEYEFEFCFVNIRTNSLNNSRTDRAYVRLYRPSNDQTYDLLISPKELKLRGEGSGDILLATR